MKKEVRNLVDLEERIKHLEGIEQLQKEQLKSDASILMKSMRPSLLLKSLVLDVVSSRTVQKNVIDTTVGMGAGVLAKKIFTLGSAGIVRRITGKLLQIITTRIVTKKMPALRHKIIP